MSSLLDKKIRNNIDAYLENARRSLRLPGLAVAVVQNSRVVYLRGLGLAGPGRGVCPETPFVLGSLSKSFTALAIMQLVESEALRLDDPVQAFLPWFCLADTRASKVTLRHLLTHSSGISRRIGRDLLSQKHDIGMEKAVRALSSVRLAHEPGTKYEYSNLNYSILGLLIEHVSGETYEGYIQRYIFNPLSMKRSFTSERTAAAVDLAVGHRWWFGVAFPSQAPYLRDALPAAFLISSAQDMARWLLTHLQGGTVDGVSVLSEVGIEELHRPQIATGKGTYAGMGWRVGDLVGEPIVLHGGEVSNYRSDMLLIPGRQIGLIVLANCNHGLVAQLGLDQIAPNLARLLLGQPQPRKRLTLRLFGLLSAAASLGLVALITCLWLVLASTAYVTPGGLVALALTALAPGLSLWRLPQLADMSWKGLRLYVPDLARLVQWLSIASLVVAGATLLRWFL